MKRRNPYYKARSTALSDEDINAESDDETKCFFVKSRFPQSEKREYHNALERKRRDHIKDSFTVLKEAIPMMHGDKASRAQILKKASDYINQMRRKNVGHQCDINDLKRQNSHLEAQIRALERAKSTGNYTQSAATVLDAHGLGTPDKANGISGGIASESESGLSEFVYEGSDSSDGSNASPVLPLARMSVSIAGTTNKCTVARPIAPGQSLLICSNEQPSSNKKLKC